MRQSGMSKRVAQKKVRSRGRSQLLNLSFIRQDFQDIQDCFYFHNFPDESDEE